MAKNQPLVLLYHEITDTESEFIKNYSINTKPKTFDQHMRVISRHFKPITYSEYKDCLKNGENITDRILVTFDDGYSEAVKHGGEILNKYNLDGIWFINDQFIKNDKIFWLSKLMYLYDEGKLKDFIKNFNEVHQGLAKKIRKWDVKSIDLWAKDNYSLSLENYLNEYVIKLGLNENNRENNSMLYASENELMMLSQNFEIGNHTSSHPNFRNLSIENKIKQSEESRRNLQKIINREINCFAFPFGQEHMHWCQNDVDILLELNYESVFSVANEHKTLNATVIPRYEIPEIEDRVMFRGYIDKLLEENKKITNYLNRA